MVKRFKIFEFVFLIPFIFSCSSYYGKKDDLGRLRINEKHWTLKNISNEEVKRVLDTEVLYKMKFSFNNQNNSFSNSKEDIITQEKDQVYLRFFKTGHVLYSIPYLSNVTNGKIIGSKEEWLNLDFGKQGFYTMGSNEFEIEFFQGQNVSLFGSMDRYYYQALIEGDTLHLIRKSPFKENHYIHDIYIKQEMPEELKNQKADW
ncbi:hypothetical protein [Aquimarina macrocephali]|uniref:hypothetical protein n=1 Tax=Aquimarina macrocephali TaxID=666563 RepID=UPI00046488F3|nr:hypothetical protein [Aquimarina macrocephali]